MENEKKKIPSTSQSRCKCPSQDSTHSFSDSSDDVNEEKMPHPNQEASEEEECVYVSPVLKEEDVSRKYNKGHHCFYCGLVVQKMSRHLAHRHSDEVNVTKAFELKRKETTITFYPKQGER